MQPQPLLAPLRRLGFVRASGEDATDFLHAQLSQRVGGLPPGLAPLGTWNDAKGRVRALVRIVPLPDGWLLVTEAESATQLLQGLRPFVMRSKVELCDDARLWQAAALLDPDPAWLADRGLAVPPQRDALVTTDGTRAVHVGPGLIHVFGKAQAIDRLSQGLTQAPQERAILAEIRLGIPELVPALAARYLPQMLNLDTLGAIAFDKGCYPGQEIIARAHYRGTVKRRLRRFESAGSEAPAPGAELVTARDEAAGEVIRAVAWEGRVELLAVVRLDLASEPLFLAPGKACPLIAGALPYET